MTCHLSFHAVFFKPLAEAYYFGYGAFARTLRADEHIDFVEIYVNVF